MTQVTRPFDRVLSRIKQEINDPQPNQEVVDTLIEIGYQALVRAAESKATGNITMNQMEAFGCAVYFRGEKQKTRFLDKAAYRGSHRGRFGRDVDSAEPDPKRHRMGRSMVLHAIRDHKPTTDWYELYLTNAMWYTAIHEHWGLQVLTQEILSTAQAVAQTCGVEVFIDVELYGGK